MAYPDGGPFNRNGSPRFNPFYLINSRISIPSLSNQPKMALQQVEKEQFGIEVAKELSQTRYACSSLSLLSGGTANFLFRGILAQPLQDGRKTVIIKHSKEFVSANRNFHLDVSRCVGYLFLFLRCTSMGFLLEIC